MTFFLIVSFSRIKVFEAILGPVFVSLGHNVSINVHFFQLAFEAERRFKDAVETVEAKLSKMQEILDWGNLMGLEEFVRPKEADAEVFTTVRWHFLMS